MTSQQTKTPVIAPGTGRIPTLDGLRGIAILFVLLIHLEEYASPWVGLLPASFLFIARNLFIGVDLFFVLSGFLITGILLDSRLDPARKALRSFYIRRALRIFPLYYSFLAFSFLFMPFLIGTFDPYVWRNKVYVSYALFLSNWLQAWRGVPLHGFLTVVWSLAIEEQFYILWPLLVRSFSARNVQRLCVLILICSPLIRTVAWLRGANMETLYILTPFRLDSLAAGAWLALFIRHAQASTQQMRTSAFRIFALATAVYIGLVLLTIAFRGNEDLSQRTYFRHHPLLMTFGFSIVAVAFAALLYLAIYARGVLRRYLASKIMGAIGRYSFSVYLLHITAGYYLLLLFQKLDYLQLGVTWASLFVFLAVYGIAVAALAKLSWWLIESPALSLKKRFPY